MILNYISEPTIEYELIPENKEECERLEELRDKCSMAPVVTLKRMLYESTTLWESIVLAEQIICDLLDFASLSVEDAHG